MFAITPRLNLTPLQSDSSPLNFGNPHLLESSSVTFDRKPKGKLLQAPLKAIEKSHGVYWSGTEENACAPCGSRSDDVVISGTNGALMSTVGKSTNIVWQECSVGRNDRHRLLGQKGCVIWVTGLSGSGKSTLACALSRGLHSMGKLTYILDGDNVRHGLCRDLSFNAEDRVENIRRIGEVAKLFAEAGVICIASLISPYRRDRDACRALLPKGNFIEVFMNVPLQVCEARDAKGLYKLARAGRIKGFTGIDDPYETPLKCEIEIQPQDGVCASPSASAELVISYLDQRGFLQP